MAGNAADFVCPEFGTPAQIVSFLQTTPLKWDNLVQEGNWVHVSFDSRMRQQVLTAHFDKDGVATYTQGAA
jgi:putative chitinase